jgi:hypothetical protein
MRHDSCPIKHTCVPAVTLRGGGPCASWQVGAAAARGGHNLQTAHNHGIEQVGALRQPTQHRWRTPLPPCPGICTQQCASCNYTCLHCTQLPTAFTCMHVALYNISINNTAAQLMHGTSMVLPCIHRRCCTCAHFAADPLPTHPPPPPGLTPFANPKRLQLPCPSPKTTEMCTLLVSLSHPVNTPQLPAPNLHLSY